MHLAEKCQQFGTTIRKGVYWDKAAKQWACRVGYDLDETTGKRVRVRVQRLTSDADTAIATHIRLGKEWVAKRRRPSLSRLRLDGARLSKPHSTLQDGRPAMRLARRRGRMVSSPPIRYSPQSYC